MMAKYRILQGRTSASSTALALKMNGGTSVRSRCSSSSSKSFRGLHHITLTLSWSYQGGSVFEKHGKPCLVPSIHTTGGDFQVERLQSLSYLVQQQNYSYVLMGCTSLFGRD